MDIKQTLTNILQGQEDVVDDQDNLLKFATSKEEDPHFIEIACKLLMDFNCNQSVYESIISSIDNDEPSTIVKLKSGLIYQSILNRNEYTCMVGSL